MTEQTLVAVFDSASHAADAVRDLKAIGVPDGAISQHVAHNASAGGSDMSDHGREQGFWGKLFGSSEDDNATYERSVADGSTVVSVRTPDGRYDEISDVLERHEPIDLDERSASYGATEVTTTRTTAAAPAAGAHLRSDAVTNDGVLELAEESLKVGKRAVSGGSTRVRRYAVETPVEEQVSLRNEQVTLDRRPVTDGRAIADGNFVDKTIEMTETNEEAVVSKTARVVEEVALRKEVSDRVETIKDTVRRDEVEIENVPGGRDHVEGVVIDDESRRKTLTTERDLLNPAKRSVSN